MTTIEPLLLLRAEDIPVLAGDGATENASGKVLVSISEDPCDEDPPPSGGGVLAGILRRDGRDSGRAQAAQNNNSLGSKFTPTKFSPANIPIPGLKRKTDKDKLKNGEAAKKDSTERKKDKQRSINSLASNTLR